MKQVTIFGTGQLNGVVKIHKTIELEDSVAWSLHGQNRDEVKIGLLAVHYPGVKINPNNISVKIEDIKKPKPSRQSRPKKKPFEFTFKNILLWILFLPFRLIWHFLKSVWKDEPIIKL